MKNKQWVGLLFWVVLPLILFSGIIVGAGFFSYRLESIDTPVRVMLKKFVGDSVTLKGVRLIPWRAITLEQLSIPALAKNEIQYSAVIQRIEIRYNLKRIWTNRAMVMRLVRERKLFGDLSTNGPAPARLQAFIRSPLAGLITEVVLENGEIQIGTPGSSSAVIRGLAGHLRLVQTGYDLCQGELIADSLVLGGKWRFEHPAGKVTFRGDSLAFDSMTATGYEGVVTGTGLLNLVQRKVQQCSFFVTGINLGLLYAASGDRTGNVEGKGSAAIELIASPFSAESPGIQGRLMLSSSVLRHFPLQKSLVRFTAMPGWDAVRFDTVVTMFAYRNGVLVNDSTIGRGPDMNITASGSTDLRTNSFSQRLSVVLSNRFCKDLPPLVVNSLIPAPDGGHSFKCTVGGTFANPQISAVQQEVIQRTINNVVNEIMDFFK